MVPDKHDLFNPLPCGGYPTFKEHVGVVPGDITKHEVGVIDFLPDLSLYDTGGRYPVEPLDVRQRLKTEALKLLYNLRNRCPNQIGNRIKAAFKRHQQKAPEWSQRLNRPLVQLHLHVERPKFRHNRVLRRPTPFCQRRNRLYGKSVSLTPAQTAVTETAAQ